MYTQKLKFALQSYIQMWCSCFTEERILQKIYTEVIPYVIAMCLEFNIILLQAKL